MNRRTMHGWVCAALAISVASCAKPPTDLLKKLKDQLAGLELAKKCAPESYRSAMKMYEEAEELNKKKLYKEATRAAEAAVKLAEKAKADAEANKDCDKTAAADKAGDKPAGGTDGSGGSTPTEKTNELPGATGGDKAAEGPVLEKVTVYFDFNKFDVRPDAVQVLTRFAASLKSKPEARIEVEGHCDARGSVEYNLALGERRAKSVREFLVSQGVSAKQVSIISYGSERPEVDGSTEEAYARNRRAVVLRR
jgi:peptidoglycan-associated lipoprotein